MTTTDRLAERLKEAFPPPDEQLVEAHLQRLSRSPRTPRLVWVGASLAIVVLVAVVVAVREPSQQTVGTMADAADTVSGDGGLQQDRLPTQRPIAGERFRHLLNLRGQLVLDDQGCVRLNSSGGVLVWPAGSRWNEGGQEVVLADGTARSIGDQVNLGVDPSARLSEVAHLLDDGTPELVSQCVPDDPDPRVSLVSERAFLPLG